MTNRIPRCIVTVVAVAMAATLPTGIGTDHFDSSQGATSPSRVRTVPADPEQEVARVWCDGGHLRHIGGPCGWGVWRTALYRLAIIGNLGG